MLKSESISLVIRGGLPYPKLMISNDKDIIILAYTEDIHDPVISGVVVETTYTESHVGKHSTKFKKDIFTDFYGSVTLTQE